MIPEKLEYLKKRICTEHWPPSLAEGEEMMQEIYSLNTRLREAQVSVDRLTEERDAAWKNRNRFCDAINEIATVVGMSGKDHYSEQAVLRNTKEKIDELGACKEKLANTEAQLTKYKAANLGKNPCVGCAGLCKAEGECAYLWAKELLQAKEKAESELKRRIKTCEEFV